MDLRDSISAMEVEAKLGVPSRDVLDAISAREVIGGFRVDARPLQPLETTYLDTATRALREARIAVRLRRGPDGVELTVKRPGDQVGDVARRPEWTIPLPAYPDLPWNGNAALLAELGGVSLDGPLRPLVTTLVRRRPLELRDAGGKLVVEIDLDEVSFRRAARGGEAVTASPPTYEVEIELRNGDEAEIPRLVEVLRRDYPLEPMRLSKLERALRWAGLDR